ncbi:P-loop NTPase family protein [Streptoalloteichus hindustanus]|uniref:Uncharacterized protein n=1 Tax=Streptoalloteichus hindustanus TaxID=2017 RepID=A0A1M5M8G5_STRHI|nr:hypothetical protein [Streptoalloteichus hindustanus]SHG73518.1 hypothetical protein SAMN05444320_11328 [Streptoalloteichus hindustanus]
MTEPHHGQPLFGAGGALHRAGAGWAAPAADQATTDGAGGARGQHRPDPLGEAGQRPVLPGTPTSIPPWVAAAPRWAGIAHRAHPGGTEQDLAGVVDTAAFTAANAAHAGADPERVRELAGEVAVGAAAALRVIDEDAVRAAEPAHLDWRAFGQVVPVLGAGAGVGASVVAAVLTDLLASGGPTLLIDPNDPARSGLSAAAPAQGPRRPSPHARVWLRCGHRGPALVLRLETTLPVITPGLVPGPRWWTPPTGTPRVTVVDTGDDGWRLATNPAGGPGVWMRRGTPAPCPVLVVRPSRPSLVAAEQLLARLEPWVHAGLVVPVRALVVSGARRWPRGVVGAAGRRVSALLTSARFLPHHPEIVRGGIGPQITPSRSRRALLPLLADLGLTPRRHTTPWWGRPGRGIVR